MSGTFTIGDRSRLVVYSAIVLNQSLRHSKERSDASQLLRFLAFEDITDLCFGGDSIGLSNYLAQLEFAGYIGRDDKKRLFLTERGLRGYKALLEKQAEHNQLRQPARSAR